MEGEIENIEGERENIEGERENMEGERERGRENERQRIETEKKKWENRTEEWLCDAAMRGDIGSLREIINTDSFILYKVCMGSFEGRNPLHVAISTGQREFVLKLLEIEPDLAEVLDTKLGAALHVACAKGYVEIVKALVEARPKMCLARDRDGNNPFHIAAMEGQLQVLEELVQTNLRRAQVKADRGDTMLHLCVKYDKPHCLKLLLEKIPDPEFVNASDIDGNTILHLAVCENQLEMIRHMLSNNVLSNSKIEVNAINKSGRTALDIHSQLEHLLAGNPSYSEIHSILLTAGAKTGKEFKDALLEKEELVEPSWQSNRRNTFMIVASLIATVTFQVGVNPPSGVYPDGLQAGNSILASTRPVTYYNLLIANTIGFLGSLSTMVLLIFALPEPKRSLRWWTRGVITWFTILAIDYTYVFSILGLTPNWCLGYQEGSVYAEYAFYRIMGLTISVTCFVWILVMAVLVLRIVSLGVAIFVTSFLWMGAMALFVYVFVSDGARIRSRGWHRSIEN